jgi:mannobiose 2-epimerase
MLALKRLVSGRGQVARYRSGLEPISAASAGRTLEQLLVNNVLPFWDERVIDRDGGYLLAFDVQGQLRRGVTQRVVTQARTMWFFSRLGRSSYGDARHLEWAAHGFAFLRERMWDRRHGGFFWELEGDTPGDARKHLYGQAFGLLGLLEFARAAQAKPARELAQELFELIERRAHDGRFGGYAESWLRDWRPEPAGAKSPLGPPANHKTINTHMHLMSALTAMVDADPVSGPRERLGELISIVSDRAVSRSPATCPTVHSRDWTPAPGWRSSFGHDLESVWLALRACQLARVSDAGLLPAWEAIWDNTLRLGFDPERGGVYSEGEPGRPADRLEKHWWVQAEAMVSARLMHRRTGDPRYERAFLQILDWIMRGQADWERGDWYRTVAPDGTVTGSKAGHWECPFHQGRALLECLGQEQPPGTGPSG